MAGHHGAGRLRTHDVTMLAPAATHRQHLVMQRLAIDPLRRNLAEAALYELAEADLIDAVEVLNAKTSLSSLNRRAADFAAAVARGVVAGTGERGIVVCGSGAGASIAANKIKGVR